MKGVIGGFPSAVGAALRGVGRTIRIRWRAVALVAAGVVALDGLLPPLVLSVARPTGPCSVVGCGAPVLPVVGLVFAGLSSTTLAVLSQLSRISAIAVIVALVLAIAWLGWQVGNRGAPRVSRGAPNIGGLGGPFRGPPG